MATAPQPTLFNQAVSRILSSWSALQIAVEHGFGGSNSKQKAQDLVSDIEGIFRAKSKLDPYDFADFLEDEVDDRFSLVLEDGSVQMISSHICQCFTLLREGQVAEVEQFLQGLPGAAHSRVQFDGANDSSDEDDNDDDDGGMEVSQSLHNPSQENSPSGGNLPCQPQQHLSQQGSNGDGRTRQERGAGAHAMDVEEEDGWTVVRRGGSKR